VLLEPSLVDWPLLLLLLLRLRVHQPLQMKVPH
jgi:hypothetical protein